MKYFVLSLICLFVLLAVNIPKPEQYMEADAVTECSCFGVSRQGEDVERTCYGLPYECKTHVEEQAEVSCSPTSCRTVKRYLGVRQTSSERELSEPEGMDVLLVIDSSLSMRGEKIAEAKDAAVEFVREMAPKDTAGVITFDNDAVLEHGLSGDRDSLQESIEDITVAENTYYIPPLRMGLDILGSDTSRRKIMIFLSDGDPLDDKEEIISLVRDMRDEGIDMYSVWLGEGGSEDNFLRQLAAEYESDLEKNYVSGSEETIAESFREIYTSVREEEYIFSVNQRFPKEVYYADEAIPVDLSLYSKENRRVIPGYHSGGNGVFCVDSAEIEAILRDGDRYAETLNFSSGSYTGLFENIPPGNYSLESNISVSYGAENCTFTDYQNLGSVRVRREEAPSCRPIPDDMITSSDGEALREDVSFEGYRRKHLILAVDTSESIGAGHLSVLKEHMGYLTGLLTKDFKVSLVSFSDEVEVLTDFTTDAGRLEERFSSVSLGGPTKLGPLLETSERMFRPVEGEKYLLIISDGVTWDERGVLEDVRRLVDEEVCVETMSYGPKSSEQDRHLMRRIGQLSVRQNGCGAHRYAFASDIRHSFREVYYDLYGGEQDLYVDVRMNNPSLGADEVFIMQAVLYSNYNGKRIPGKGMCPPNLTVSLESPGGERYTYEALYVDGRYRLALEGFVPGFYTGKVNTSVATSEGVLRGSREFSFYVDGPRFTSIPVAYTLMNILLGLGACVSLLFGLWVQRYSVSAGRDGG